MKTKLKSWYQRQHFDPGVAGWLVNPFFIARRGLHRALVHLLPQLRGDVLDVGCGTMPYRRFVPATRYVGLDYDTPQRREAGYADIFYDGRKFPVGDSSFDGVLCTQVLEHVFNPEEFLGEIARVLRPGGSLVLTVPFIWDEHEQPYDFGRYSSFGLKALLEKKGFDVVKMEKIPADARAVGQIVAGWVYKVTLPFGLLGRLVVQGLLIAPITIISVALAMILPRNEDFYLDNVLLARRVKTESTKV